MTAHHIPQKLLERHLRRDFMERRNHARSIQLTAITLSGGPIRPIYDTATAATVRSAIPASAFLPNLSTTTTYDLPSTAAIGLSGATITALSNGRTTSLSCNNAGTLSALWNASSTATAQ